MPRSFISFLPRSLSFSLHLFLSQFCLFLQVSSSFFPPCSPPRGFSPFLFPRRSFTVNRDVSRIWKIFIGTFRAILSLPPFFFPLRSPSPRSFDPYHFSSAALLVRGSRARWTRAPCKLYPSFSPDRNGTNIFGYNERDASDSGTRWTRVAKMAGENRGRGEPFDFLNSVGERVGGTGRRDGEAPSVLPPEPRGIQS